MAARWLVPVFLFALSCVCPALAGDGGDGAEKWLNLAADAQLDARHREYAAQRIIMLADSSASILIAALNGSDGGDSALRRQVAATLLGEIAPPQAEASLLEAAFGADWFLAESAKKALAALYARLPDNTLYTLLTRGAREISGSADQDGKTGGDDWLALSLQQAQYRGRFKALVMAGVAKKYNAAPKPLPDPLAWCVREGLLDIDPGLRAASIETLPHITGGEAPERLAALLYTETDEKVLLAALAMMARLRPPQFGEAVERHAAHANPGIALEACAALAAMGYPGALFPPAPNLKAAATFVNHPSTPVRRRAIELLTESKNPAAVEYLSAALFDRVWANRAAAAYGLGELGFPSAVGALHPLLNDARPEVREEAAIALSRFDIVGVASRMVDEARGTSLPLPFRLAAVRALGRMGDRRAVPALLECLNSGDFPLVAASIDALVLLGDERAVAPLEALLAETEDVVLADLAEEALKVLEVFR